MKAVVLALACATAATTAIVGILRPDVRLSDEFIDRVVKTSSIMSKADRASPKSDRFQELPEMPVELAQAETSPASGATDATPVVDESALRYFASKGDRARLEAEIARLRALYPNWIPPKDPLAVPQNEDKQLERMWQLYSEARYADVRKAIADRRIAEPNWVVPADLLERLTIAERRSRLIAASDSKNFAEVVTIGADTPSLLTCSDVDVLWRVAEAFASTDRHTRALDAYTYILKNCEDQAERIATIQKAAALLPYQPMQDLLGYERTLADGSLEFEPVRDGLSRRFVSEGDEDTALTVAVPYLQRVERLVEREGLAADALLLGWYYLRRDTTNVAERWFRKAYEIEDSAPAAQGLALALIELKNPQEAENVLYRWRDSSADAKATYLAATANLLALDPPPELSTEVLGRVAAVTLKERDPVTAQEFGWYALAFGQPTTAAQWFTTALGWKPDDEPSAYGLAVSRLRLRDTAGVREIQAEWRGRSERIARVGEPEKTPARVEEIREPRQAIVETQIERQPARSESRIVVVEGAPARGPRVRSAAPSNVGCRTTVDPTTLAPQVALDRGWCLMRLNRPLEAAAAFGVALRGTSGRTREDAAYGQSLAYLRAGLINQAAVSAAKSPLSPPRQKELQSTILSDRAVAAFDAGRYRETLLFLDQRAQLRTETVGLMVLRGYSYKNLNRRSDALRVFEALASVGNRDGIRALGDMREEESIRK
ncbi:cellulose synthase [Sinorhizobium sp. BG8]|uniref:cellulose synthase n=1 Tax=Sinorhizobium sp. BG8 TaxID=2613773 RepID=UPI00193DD70F|nr:cellulose synthase [Sinorhizobium sp. BG8]QRM57966.1 cellulose synthase [Sinorhizobium sp. BG8]